MSKKSIDVAKFGGTDELGKAKLNGHEHDVSSIETQSRTKLEDDAGHGAAVIIRCFTFGANPIAFKEHTPTKQELFNYHLKHIEMELWKDGMIPHSAVEPRLAINKQKGWYQIFVTAKPARGHLLNVNPQTLTEIAHG